MGLYLVKSRKWGDRYIKIDEWMLPVLKCHYVNINVWTGYVQCKPRLCRNASTIPLQRLVLITASVLNAEDVRVADHMNGIKDNYTLENLKAILQAENARKQVKHKTRNGEPTTSEYRGVSWNKKTQQWYATIVVNKVQLNLGNYDDPLIAAFVYDFFAAKLFEVDSALNKVVLTKAQQTLVDIKTLCQRGIKNLNNHGLHDDATKLMGAG